VHAVRGDETSLSDISSPKLPAGGRVSRSLAAVQVVITGGAGFIGANLCRHLCGRGDDVTVIDDFSTGRNSNLAGLDVRLVRGTILDDAALDDAFAGADAVVHLAALGSVPRSVADPIASHHANATGTVMVLEAARRHGLLHTVVASSSSVYGSNPVLPKHEDLATRPMSPYAGSKLATEGYALAWQASYDLPVLAFRFFNVYGPLQPADHVYAAVIPRFVHAALAGEPLTVHGDGTQSRDFTYVGTLCAVVADALARRVTSPEPVNLAFGTRCSLLDLIGELEAIVGHPVSRVHEANRRGDVPHSQADASRLFGLFPDIAPVALADGLRATVDWMRSVDAAR
jgi:UDP-glucose 4-epimerase